MKIVTCQTCFVTSEFPDHGIDQSGLCHWCRASKKNLSPNATKEIDFEGLKKAAERIKSERTGKYDCIIGVSGGLDSSYMAFIAARLMGLKALLVHYDHGYFYSEVEENLRLLAKDLGLDLRTVKSQKAWDKRYVNTFSKAFSKANVFWGICSACHYALPAAVIREGKKEGIIYYIGHSNKYELSLHVPRKHKVNFIIKNIRKAGLLHTPKMIFYFLLSQYYLFRLKLELYVPPLKNLFKNAPKKTFKLENLTRYVPWNIKKMTADLIKNTAWKPASHPNLGMRFDCMIEDSFINTSYKRATGSTVHAIIANNLIHDGAKSKQELVPIVNFYDENIENAIQMVKGAGIE